MKTLISFVAVVLAASTASACDSLTGCYAAPLIQRQVVRSYVVQPYVQQQIVEYQVVPQVQVQKVIQKQVVRQKVVVERQRAYPLRAAVSVPARVVERLVTPRQKVIRRERVVERAVY
jgi:hypothetical protein